MADKLKSLVALKKSTTFIYFCITISINLSLFLMLWRTNSSLLAFSNIQFLFFMICVLVMLGGYQLLKPPYVRKYRELYVKPFLKEHLKEVRYVPDGGIATSTLEGTQILPMGDRYITENLIMASYGGHDFSVCDLSIYELRQSQKGSKYCRQFYGLMLAIEYEKPFEAIILGQRQNVLNFWTLAPRVGYLSDESGNILEVQTTNPAFMSSLFKKSDHSKSVKLQRIKMIAPSYEKSFETWSNDQVLSRKILKPVMLEKLAKLTEHYKISYAIIGSKIYLALEGVPLQFMPRPFFLPMRSEKMRYKKVYQSIQVIKNLIDTLDF